MRASSEVAHEVEQAEAQLKTGDYAQARRTARALMRTARPSRAFAVIVMSYCGEGNFGTAQDWLARVQRKDRDHVLRYCHDHGIELNN